jgi:DNA topoisomerase-3
MKIAETLYLRGYTTYPRTESTSFSENFDFKEILKQHTSHSDWGEYAQKLLTKGHHKPKKGADAGDHPPITPVRAARRGELSDREWRVYSYITRSFLGCLSRDAVYDAVAVMFETGSEQFTLKGKVLLDPGFLEIMHW